jgi:hypothetical protein
MQNDNSLLPAAEMQGRLALLRAASAGDLEGLPCPQCQRPSITVWFTHPAETLYRTWFVCAACGFEMRAQNAGRPPYYSEDRDRTARDPAEAHGPLATDQRS